MKADAKTIKTLDRTTAEEWASWFRALGDPTRVLILHLLSSAAQPMTVGEVTDALDVGQSTISHHLAKLADVGFVHRQTVGTSSLWHINRSCLAAFPSAAEMVMGRIPNDFTDAISPGGQERATDGR
ncbi:MAG: metalloregulator ArsR/SmtB family transcription factor [Actinomycetota bacterium]